MCGGRRRGEVDEATCVSSYFQPITWVGNGRSSIWRSTSATTSPFHLFTLSPCLSVLAQPVHTWTRSSQHYRQAHAASTQHDTTTQGTDVCLEETSHGSRIRFNNGFCIGPRPAQDSWWKLLHHEEPVEVLARNKIYPTRQNEPVMFFSWPMRISADIRFFCLRLVADLDLVRRSASSW